MGAFPLGVELAALAMQQPALARAVPIAVGVVVLSAGALQCTVWKARHLAYCREAPGTAARCRPTPVRRGDTACALASTAAVAVPV
jgi:predicted metal-binding membrane protein